MIQDLADLAVEPVLPSAHQWEIAFELDYRELAAVVGLVLATHIRSMTDIPSVERRDGQGFVNHHVYYPKPEGKQVSAISDTVCSIAAVELDEAIGGMFASEMRISVPEQRFLPIFDNIIRAVLAGWRMVSMERSTYPSAHGTGLGLDLIQIQ